MDLGTVFLPTEKGKSFTAHANPELSIVERRLLALTDGHSTLTDLAAKVRFNDLVPAIERLIAFDLIVESTQPGHPPRVASSPGAFYAVRQAASKALRAQLLTAADILCGEVENCSDAESLRKTLRSLDSALTQSLHTDALRTLARHYGRQLID